MDLSEPLPLMNQRACLRHRAGQQGLAEPGLGPELPGAASLCHKLTTALLLFLANFSQTLSYPHSPAYLQDQTALSRLTNRFDNKQQKC